MAKFNPDDFKELVSSEPIVIADNDDAIIIKIKSYKGNSESIDIRRYYVDKETGEYRPSAKGVSLKLSDIDNPAISILEEAIKMIKEYQATKKS